MGKIIIGLLIAATIAVCYHGYSRSQKFAPKWLREPDSFMDIRFGENVKDKLPRCASKYPVEEPPCWRHLIDDVVNIENVIVGDYSLGHITVRQPGGRLEQVEIKFITGRYPEMLDILTKRYGKPIETKTEPWQSKAGAMFTNEISSWIGKNIEIRLVERGDTVDEGSVLYTTATWRAASEAEKQERVQQGADAL